VLSEVCKDTDQNNALAAVSALRKYEDGYFYVVYVGDSSDGWATLGASKTWANTCGKDIAVFRTPTGGNACSTSLKDKAKKIIFGALKTSEKLNILDARTQMGLALKGAGIQNHGILLHYSERPNDEIAENISTCYLYLKNSGKSVMVHLQN